MAITFTVESFLELNAEIQRAFDNIDDTSDMMSDISFYLDKETKLALRGNRSGITYKKVMKPRVSDPLWPRRTRTHQASAEGEAPRTDSGGLINSIKRRSSRTKAVVGTKLKYADTLEDPNKLNRPWMKTVSEGSRSDIQRIINGHVERALRG